MKSTFSSVLSRSKSTGIFGQFLKFAGVGAIGTSGHYLTLIILVQAVGISPVIASTGGFVVGALINYVLNYVYTFASDKGHAEAIVKFFAVAALGAGLNATIMYIGANIVHIHYLLAQIAATGIVVFITFLLNRLWTFSS